MRQPPLLQRDGLAWPPVVMSGAAFVPLFLLAGFFPAIRHEHSISSSLLGLSVSAFYLSSTIAYAISAALADRFAPHIMLRSGAVAISLATAQLAWQHPPAWLIPVAMILAGAGHSVVQTASNTWLAHASTRPAFGFGAKQSSAAAAGMIAGLIVAITPPHLWWATFLVVAVVIASGAILVRDPHVDIPMRAAATAPSTLRTQWPNALCALAGAAAALTAAAYIAESMVAAGFDLSSAGMVMFWSGLLCTTGRLAIGRGLDRLPRAARAVCAMIWLCATAGFVLLAVQASSGAMIVVGSVLAYGVGWTWTGALLFAVASENPHHVAKTTGFIQSAAALGGMSGPLLAGIAMVRWGFPALWSACAVLTAIAAALVLATSAQRGPEAATS